MTTLRLPPSQTLYLHTIQHQFHVLSPMAGTVTVARQESLQFCNRWGGVATWELPCEGSILRWPSFSYISHTRENAIASPKCIFCPHSGTKCRVTFPGGMWTILIHSALQSLTHLHVSSLPFHGGVGWLGLYEGHMWVITAALISRHQCHVMLRGQTSTTTGSW